ncbi:MAG: sulfite exporter TauE/SafE family protein [Betaproteobacteria bacterium]|nr:sulfite exporter TauE/SafE family protein [Betaproteobacteria bacterium]
MIASLLAVAGWPQLAFCALVVLAAYTLRGAAGFGAGIVAIPLLLLVLPLRDVIPVITTLGLAASLGQSLREFRHVDWRGLRRLVLPTLAGVAAGLWLFSAVHPQLLLKAFGVFIIGYALWSLAPPRPATLRVPARVLAPAAGGIGALVATVFGGMAGPFYVVYLSTLRLDKTRFRASVSVVLFALGVLRAAGYGGLGLYDREVLVLLALLFPVMGLAMIAGNHLHRRLDERAFKRIVAVLLAASGALLLFK